MLRTRLSICRKKVSYRTEADALAIVFASGLPLRPYRCDRCLQFHLTSRRKGKRVPRMASVVTG
ncbi:hypothetical protein EKN06_03080 [Croceicoccus ponticola]|uniref:Uncharacterized protein n=1 Tax=Croceicoccus ponticola TaxID=2217664 RepID=A0A437H0N8_9SPHN|nr:hypothetical protein EKN06_03080 [Croceicoccus ponticola]